LQLTGHGLTRKSPDRNVRFGVDNFEFARHVHNYLGEFIRAADQKAAFLLVAATTLLGWLATRTMTDWRLCIQVIAMILAGTSSVLAVWSVKPRQHRLCTGLIAWCGILKTGNSSQYLDSVSVINDGGLQEIATHSHELAKILKRKYDLLWLAIWAFILAGVTTVPLVVASALPHTKLNPSSVTSCGVKAELQRVVFSEVYNPNEIELEYLVTNRSGQDYVLPETFRSMRKSRDGALQSDMGISFPQERFFPDSHAVRFSAWVNVGNLLDHPPTTEKDKSELEKQLAATESYLIFDGTHHCEVELPAHR
jgi:hypothetical protein